MILDNIDRNLDDGIIHYLSVSPLNQLIALRDHAAERFFLSIYRGLFT